jgi:hypothetical protein
MSPSFTMIGRVRIDWNGMVRIASDVAPRVRGRCDFTQADRTSSAI